jgi:outer membrane protein, adhesin transport system
MWDRLFAALGPAALLGAALLAPAAAFAQCPPDEPGEAGTAAATDAAPPADPRATLATLVRDALGRNQALGAARLLADAAVFDLAEVLAMKDIQASAQLAFGPGGTRTLGINETSAAQLRAGLSVSQLLYDGGRVDRLTDWRRQLAESARLGHLSQREQIAAATVGLALERSRYRQQSIIYGQYGRKMGCLVAALETIVRADRGRASELVQAKKNQQQAELLLVGAQSAARQIDVRLRRLVGDGLPGVEGLSTVLLAVPELGAVQAEVERSTDIAQIAAQARAAGHYADAVATGHKPQISWSLSGSQSVGTGGSRGHTASGNFALGVAVNIPLVNPSLKPASEAARRRAQAAELQRADALDARRARAAEVHEQTLASFDRARRVGAVLRDSEQVRNFTLQQWQQLGRRSLFDVMGAEADHYSLRVAYINALHDGQQLNANLLSLGRGVGEWLQ